MKLKSAIPIRLTPETDKAVRRLQKSTKVSFGALLRLAVAAGLPEIEKRFAPEPIEAGKGE